MRISWTALRRVIGIGLVSGIGGCSEPTKAPSSFVATLAPVIVLPRTANAAFPVDAVRIRVIRPPSQSVLDTVVPFPAASASLNVRLRVPLNARLERLSITVELLVLSRPYFAATALVDVTAEGFGGGPAQPVLNLLYVGPGAAAQTLRVTPRDTTVTVGDPVQMRVAGFDGAGAPVTELLVTWSTSNPAIVIASDGSFTAPGTPGSVRVRAATPTGIVDSTTVTFASPAPTSLVITGGDQQNGQVGTGLVQPLQVLVLGRNSLPFPGATVQFRALSGGAVTTGTVVTNAQGIAQTLVTLGTVAGRQDFEAAVGGLQAVIFAATAVAGPATAIHYVSGGGQIGTVSAPLASPLTAMVVDAFGNGVSGVSVNWGVAVGTGTLGATASTSNAAGLATNTFTLGGTLGWHGAVASILVAANNPVFFSAIGQAGPGRQLFVYSGDGQQLTAPTVPLPRPLVVRVTDTFGNPSAGAVVTWAITAATGTLGISNPTNADGVTQVTFTPSSAGVSVNIRATITGGATYTFILPTSQNQFQLVATSGSGQNFLPAQSAQIPFIATVVDATGFGIANQLVSWNVVFGQGTVSPGSVQSNSFGDVATFYTANLQAGTVVVQASLFASSATTTSFLAHVLPGPAVNPAMFDGDQQAGKGGTTLPIPLQVLVLDGFGNLVPGAAVTWTALNGGTVGTAVATADQRGVASTTVRLGLSLGAQQFQASVASGSFVLFTVTAR